LKDEGLNWSKISKWTKN